MPVGSRSTKWQSPPVTGDAPRGLRPQVVSRSRKFGPLKNRRFLGALGPKEVEMLNSRLTESHIVQTLKQVGMAGT